MVFGLWPSKVSEAYRPKLFWNIIPFLTEYVKNGTKWRHFGFPLHALWLELFVYEDVGPRLVYRIGEWQTANHLGNPSVR